MKMFPIVLAGTVCLAAGAATGQSLSERYQYVMQKRAQAEANNTSKAEMLSKLLYTDLTVQFDETTARDAIDYIRTATDVPIVARYLTDMATTGIDPDALITLDVENRPALTVLELVLEQAVEFEDTTWQMRDGFIEVGPKDRLAARNAQEIRYYPIRDLLFEPPKFDNAPDLDLDSALNQGGGGFGGGGGGGGGGFGGGGGGGGFGGGGGGSGGGGGGGSIFGDPGEDPERVSEEEKAQELIEIITELVEPEGWQSFGGDWASIRYYQGTLIIRAPDFVHRQIGGYPFAIRPVRQSAVNTIERRYVTFTGSVSNVTNADFQSAPPVSGAAGGSN